MNLKKSYFWNTLGSGLNSFNSLFLLILVTRINGIKDAGLFTFSFATACMFYVIATYAGRTYQVTENEKDINDNEFIMHRIICSVVMIIVSIFFCLINHYSKYKFIIFSLLCLFKCSEAISDVFYGILQKNNKLDIVGKSLFFRSLLDVIIFGIIDYVTNNLIISCISMIIVNIIFLIFIDSKLGLKFKDDFKIVSFFAVKKIFVLGFFTFGFSFVANYLVNAPRYAIDSIMSEDFQTIFGIIVMPASIIMLINQFIIQPIITTIKKYYNERNKKEFLKIIFKVIFATFIVGVIAIIGAYFLGVPVLDFMYHLDLSKYKYDLLLIIFGATLYTVASVLSNGLIVLRKTKVQLGIYVITSIFAFVISYKLVDLFGFNGAVYSYLSIMILLLLLYIVYFIFVFNEKKIWEK